ncbi:MAG: VWA domain-containing protein [Pyrinomonadaceae bacterium]|nr:VWA domain-containing protein [Pyrinomonadaceae bacterium]
MKFFVCIFIFFFLITNYSFSQTTTERKKTKIKDFGSSLKRKTNQNKESKNSTEKSTNSDEDVIRIDTNLVVLDCLVTDVKGNVITGLTAEDFVIKEDNKEQQIQSFTLGNDAKVPRSIVLVIDYSGSQKPYIERSVEAAKLLVDKLRPNDLMAIVTDDVELIAQFTSDKIKLKKELNGLKKTGGISFFGFGNFNIGKSKQFSALYAALNEMFDETDVRPIIIFQTDGDELLFLNDQFGDEIYPQNAGRKTGFSSTELFDLTNKSRASIYSVFVGAKLLGLSEEEKKRKQEAERRRYYRYWGINPDRIPPLTPQQQERVKEQQATIKKYYPNGLPDPQEFMSNLSQQTGGWIEFLEEPEQADGIYNRILAELNTRYIIGYIPTNETKDGKKRAVKIEIKNHPEYKVLGKTTYIAK